MNREKLAEKLAIKAGRFLYKNFNEFNLPRENYKAGREIVTKYDKGSEQIIINGIYEKFPNDAILSEESGLNDKDSEYLWVVDPLDGTTNFVMYNPIFSVSIGLFKIPQGDKSKAKIIFGVVYVPVLNDLYTAELGQGAYLNRQRIKVSKLDNFKQAQHTFCHGSTQGFKDLAADYYSRVKKAGVNIRQLGSAAIELSLVAQGRNETLVIPGANAWDVAAGVLLVREAGGKVTDAQGEDWDINSQDIVATNSILHQETLNWFNGKNL